MQLLTDETLTTIRDTRAEFFAAATSTTTDRELAERAVATIVAPALPSYQIHWASSPQDAASLGDSLRGPLGDSLRRSLSNSLWDSLRAPLGDSLGDALWDSLGDSFSGALRAALSAPLRTPLRDVLWHSLWDSLWDSDWTAYWIAAVRITGRIGPDVDRLVAYASLARSAFALWTFPGHVILCLKPATVVVTDGRLVSVKWD
jgi:hypothetical protein